MKYAWLIALAACTSEPDTRPETLDYITEAILVPYCGRGGCHTTNTAAANLVFDNVDDTRLAMHGSRARVVPGDIRSQFLNVIRDTRRPMPPDQPLPDADVDLIQRWILAGAEGL